MKIRQVVGYTTFDGQTGGVYPVAQDQVGALRKAGHDAELFCVSDQQMPQAALYEHIFHAYRAPGRVGLRLAFAAGFPEHCLAGLRPGVDVLHLHLARDLVTCRVAGLARRRGIDYVVQTHGMITATSSPTIRLFDRAYTRPALVSAAAALTLTEVEGGALSQLAPDLLQQRVHNATINEVDDSVTPTAGVFVFLGRIATNKRPWEVVQAVDSVPGAHCVLVGAEGDATGRLEAALQNVTTAKYLGGLSRKDALSVLRRAWALVLPSRQDPFPMAIIEALSFGVPCVVHESSALADRIREFGAGVVIGDEPGALAAAIASLLDPRRRAAQAAAALLLSRERLSMQALIEQLESCYSSAAANGRRREGS